MASGTPTTAPVPDTLRERLKADISRLGPMPFSRWMDLCLYDPVDGYYMRPGRKTGVGRDADFVTPPTLHPFFAHAIAKEIYAGWERCGRPDKFAVLEWGGGEGDLARGALAYLDQKLPAFAAQIRWIHHELSPEHRRRQALAPDPRMSWVDPNHTRALLQENGFTTYYYEDGEGAQVFVLAVEFLDALPFDIREWQGDRWADICVGYEDGKFIEVAIPDAAPDRHYHLREKPYPVGQRFVVNQGNLWAEAHLGESVSSILIVDYGDRDGLLQSDGRLDGTVRGFRSHSYASVLDTPGQVDITASVDFDGHFSWLLQEGVCGPRSRGHFTETLYETLESFMLRHGILEELNRIDRTTTEGASSYLRLRQLLLPTGMGTAFKVARYDRPGQVTTESGA